METSDSNSEAYLVQGHDHVRKLQQKPVLLPAPFLLGRDCTFQRQTGPKRALKEVDTES